MPHPKKNTRRLFRIILLYIKSTILRNFVTNEPIVVKLPSIYYNPNLMPPKAELTCITHASTKNMTEEEIIDWKNETFRTYSRVVPSRSLSELQNEFPNGKRQDSQFIVDSGIDQRIFDENGREIIHEWYHPSLRAKNHPFSVYRKMTSRHDKDGYITYMSEMHMGKIGFTTTFIYKLNEQQERILDKVVIQDVNRQGVMEPGLPIHNPIPISFTDLIS